MYPTLTLSRGSDSLALTSANGISVLGGVEGLDTPAVMLSETEPADFDGAVVTNVRYAPRQVFLPLLLEGGDMHEVRSRTRALASLLNPKQGQVTLSVDHPPTASGELLSANAVDGVASAFDAGSGDTLTTETTTKRTGANSLKITGSTPLTATLKAAERPTVTPGSAYTASVWVKADTTPSTVYLAMVFYDQSGAVITSTYSSGKTSSASLWTRITLTLSAPVNAVKVGMLVRANAQTHFWDDFSLIDAGVQREITGYLSEPIGSAIDPTEVAGWRRLGLTFSCPDPLWVGPVDGGSVQTPGSLNATTPIASSGDASAWPTMTLELSSLTPSPGDGVTIALLPEGGVTINDALAGFVVLEDGSGDTITINTDPRSLSVERQDGSSAWSLIADTTAAPASLFSIPPGQWELLVEGLLLGVSIASRVETTWRSRWLTAW